MGTSIGHTRVHPERYVGDQAAAFHDVAVIYERYGYQQDAEREYIKAIHVYEKLGERGLLGQIRCYFDLADLCWRELRQEEARALYRRLLTLCEKVSFDMAPSLAFEEGLSRTRLESPSWNDVIPEELPFAATKYTWLFGEVILRKDEENSYLVHTNTLWSGGMEKACRYVDPKSEAIRKRKDSYARMAQEYEDSVSIYADLSRALGEHLTEAGIVPEGAVAAYLDAIAQYEWLADHFSPFELLEVPDFYKRVRDLYRKIGRPEKAAEAHIQSVRAEQEFDRRTDELIEDGND